MPTTTSIPGLPDPPAPGASTSVHRYPELEHPDPDQRGEPFKRGAVPGSHTTGVAGDGHWWRWFNPLRWFGKTVSYVSETRYFNEFRMERRPQNDRYGDERAAATGEREVRRTGNVCWTVEKFIVSRPVELAYDELVRYEIWMINLTQTSYYSFVTGGGGQAIDVAAGTATAGLEGAAVSATAAAGGSAAVEATMARIAAERAAGATVVHLTQAEVSGVLANATGVAARVTGLAGWGFLVFQGSTAAWVAWSGGSANAAGDKIAEGWEFHRRYWDDPIQEDREEWRVVVPPHPCSEAEASTAKLIAGTDFTRQMRWWLLGLPIGAVALAVALIAFAQRGDNTGSGSGGGGGGATATATATDTATQPAAAATVAPLVVGQISAVLGDPNDVSTTYSIAASGGAGRITYEWTLTVQPGQPDCGGKRISGNTAVWSHSNDAPDSCSHPATGHPFVITVVVKDGVNPPVTRTYAGTTSNGVPKAPPTQ